MAVETAGAVPSVPRARSAYRARVERIVEHCADTRSLFLRMIDGQMPRFLPGMFVSVSIPLENETRVRPYTIASDPEDGELFELCFNLVPNGPGAAWMFARRLGNELEFTGPFGAFVLETPPPRETIFVAEGTAIAPVRPMISRALASVDGPAVHLLYAADASQHLLYRSEFEALARSETRFEFAPMVVDGSQEKLYRRIEELVQTRWVTADSQRGRNFFIAGVGAGVLKLRDLLRGSGYERRSVKYEQW